MSTFFIAVVVTIVTERLVEPRLGTYTPALAVAGGAGGSADIAGMDVPDEDADEKALLGDESRGLRFALYGVLASILVIVLLVAPPGAPLRDPESDAIIGNTPFMDSLIFLITLIFLVAGICYGWGAKTVNTSVGVINAITETFASLAGLIFMLLLISQFIAYFNFSNMPTVIAVKMADLLERADIGAIWLLILFILVIALLDIIIPGVVPKWAIFAPIFIPLFYRLGVAPQTVLAAYRVGDSPMNVITPLMVYLPFIVVVAQRYKKDAGLGTIISLMLPVHGDHARGLDPVLRRLVPDRDPVRAGVPRPALSTGPGGPHESHHHLLPRARGGRRAVRLGALPGRAGRDRRGAHALGDRRARASTRRSPGSATRR